MRILTRNIVSSVLRVGVIISLLVMLIMAGADLFSNLDTYTRYHVAGGDVLKLTLLYLPQAFLFAAGPAFLLSVIIYLSMLHASNEIICILNAGVSYRQVLIPILITAVFVSGFCFGFNEHYAIEATARRDAMLQVITSTENGSKDNSQIALSDMQSGYMVYADTYSDARQMLYNVTFIERDDASGTLIRTDAYTAEWSDDIQRWVFRDAYEYRPLPDGSDTIIEHYNERVNDTLRLEPQLFRNISTEVSNMPLRLARSYVMRMKMLNPELYSSIATEYYERIFSCLTPLVLMIIACSMNYRIKKNVLFFSIIISIAIYVVYYVIRLMTMMLATQGVIAPYWGPLVPFISVLILSTAVSLISRN